MSRAQTLILALLALHLLLGGLCVAISRGEHKSRALRWWGLGLLVYAGALLFTMTATYVLPRALALTLGNTMVAFSSALCILGVLAHTPSRLNRTAVGAGLGVTAAVIAFANVAGYHALIVNMGAPTIIASVLFLYGAWAIASRGPRDARAASQFLGGILVLAVATWLGRIAAMLVILDGASDAERIDVVVSLFAIAQMVNGVAATLALIWIDVRLMQSELSRVAHTDALTGLPNRREVRRRFQEEASRAARHGQRFALVLFDVDHFKRVNDEHGHAVGDTVLQGIANVLAASKRNEDVLGRIGGEEFLVVLAQQTREGAAEAAERLRAALRDADLEAGPEGLRMTLSGGVALYPDDGAHWDPLFAAADRRLYSAKRAGRDRIEANG
jgi:diguanylate cyclase (GGDEF)-like protein